MLHHEFSSKVLVGNSMAHAIIEGSLSLRRVTKVLILDLFTGNNKEENFKLQNAKFSLLLIACLIDEKSKLM